VLLLAWNVWSVVRVAAYVLIGAAAAAPVLRLAGWRVDAAALRILAVSGAIGVVVDLVLKLALSPTCGRLLASVIDIDAAKANRSSEAPLTLHLD
jgi:spore maturation protein SpmB